MKMIFQLAWKNIWRSKRRSAVMISAIAVGLWGGLFSGGFMRGMVDAMVNSAIDRELTHIQIHAKGYREFKNTENAIPSSDSIIGQIGSMSEVSGVSGRMMLEGIVASASKNTGVQLIGIVPKDESNCTSISKSIIEGTYFDKDSKSLHLVIGKRLLEKLNLKLNSRVVLTFQAKDSSLISAAFRVVGIYQSESSVFDGLTVFAQQSDLAKLYGGKLVHQIAIRLHNHKDLVNVLNDLRNKYPEFDIQDWKELSPGAKVSIESIKLFVYIFFGIILLALLFGITNTMLMAVFDRIREFGMLIAVGMKRYRLFILVIIETVFLSLAGGVVGVLFGWATIQITGSVGINMGWFSEGLLLYGISAIIYPAIPLSDYIILTLMIIVTAIIAGVYPAVKVIHLEPVKAMRTY